METNTPNYYAMNGILADEERMKCMMRPLVEQTVQLDTATATAPDSNASPPRAESRRGRFICLLSRTHLLMSVSSVHAMPCHAIQ